MKKMLLVILATMLLGSCFLANNAIDVVRKTTDADHIIASYEWYFDSYEGIKALNRNIDTALAQLETSYTRGTPEYDRRMIEINGQIAILQTRISEYNSKSRQITRNLWKGGDLPYQISVEDLSE